MYAIYNIKTPVKNILPSFIPRDLSHNENMNIKKNIRAKTINISLMYNRSFFILTSEKSPLGDLFFI